MECTMKRRPFHYLLYMSWQIVCEGNDSVSHKYEFAIQNGRFKQKISSTAEFSYGILRTQKTEEIKRNIIPTYDIQSDKEYC